MSLTRKREEKSETTIFPPVILQSDRFHCFSICGTLSRLSRFPLFLITGDALSGLERGKTLSTRSSKNDIFLGHCSVRYGAAWRDSFGSVRNGMRQSICPHRREASNASILTGRVDRSRCARVSPISSRGSADSTGVW